MPALLLISDGWGRNFMDLSGKTAIVTGASRGIGLAIAKALAREGVKLALISRTKPPASVKGKFIACDLADSEKIPAAVASALWLVLREEGVPLSRELAAGVVLGLGAVVRQTTALVALGLHGFRPTRLLAMLAHFKRLAFLVREIARRGGTIGRPALDVHMLFMELHLLLDRFFADLALHADTAS